MKIGILVASMAVGGAERVALNISRTLSSADHDVELVLVRTEGALLDEVPGGVAIFDLQASRARAAIAALRSYLRANVPDVLLAINFEVNLAAALAALSVRPGPRLVLSVHMPIAPWLAQFPWPKRKLMDIASRALYRRADRIVAVSDGIAADLVERGWSGPAQVAAINNPVLPGGIKELAAEPVAHPWLQDADVPCILTLGRLTELKNHALLIRAFERLNMRRAARLLIVGDGECREALEAQVARAGLSAVIGFLGHAANPFPLLRAADLFVLSSDFEGFGNVLVEAMAVGTPIVATDCDYGPREILEAGKWGRLVPPGNEEALTLAMLRGLDDPRCTAFERASVFAVEAKCEEYLRLLESLLNSQASAG